MMENARLLPVKECLRDCYYFDYYDNGKGECPPTCLLMNKEHINPNIIDKDCQLYTMRQLLMDFLEWLDKYDFLIADPLRADNDPCQHMKTDEWEKNLMITEYLTDGIRNEAYEKI